MCHYFHYMSIVAMASGPLLVSRLSIFGVYIILTHVITRKLCYRKDDRAMRAI